jgi:hypothetical protein
LYPRTFCSEFVAVVFSLLGYFLSMITALTAVVAVMIGFFDTSTSERVHHYPRPAFDRDVTVNREPRLFMVVPKSGSPTKNGSPAKNTVEADSTAVEANSAAAPTEKAEVKKSRPHKPKAFARLRNNYGRPGYYENTMGYAQETQPQRLFSNW